MRLVVKTDMISEPCSVDQLVTYWVTSIGHVVPTGAHIQAEPENLCERPHHTLLLTSCCAAETIVIPAQGMSRMTHRHTVTRDMGPGRKKETAQVGIFVLSCTSLFTHGTVRPCVKHSSRTRKPLRLCSPHAFVDLIQFSFQFQFFTQQITEIT